MSNKQLEICVGSWESAMAAQLGGADRIELCDNLAEGGTTPSYGMLLKCKKTLQIPFFPIIRPRGGDFVFSDDEFEIMKEDVIACKDLGCKGIVIGILRKDGSIDTERCAHLIDLARGLEITFHRAFDRCNDLKKGLEDIIGLGCHRVLTSGGKEYAFQGLEILKSLIIQAGPRISIMPGSGVKEQNLAQIAQETGAHEFHTTAKIKLEYGIDATTDLVFSTFETSIDKVAQLKQILSKI
ncbi:copper homeostasis protein CutC [Daejeonella sp.]|uniref:copper homeostasis protein CutC n=1 Tax=Daejeonella sp. TaxID=2805397 RepID=UPI0037C1285C